MTDLGGAALPLDFRLEEMTRFGRLYGIDLLKIYAIIMVVLTHCWSEQFIQARYAELWIYNAVPFFIIIAAFNYSRKCAAMWTGVTPPPRNG